MVRNLCLLLTLFVAAPAVAQMTERIETDRPDQTESPFVVPTGYFQGEFGFNIAKYQGNVQQVLHPTSLLKYGLNKRMELRLEVTPYTELVQYIPNSKKELKLEPVEVGAKLRLFEEKGLLPKTSLIAHVGLPFLASSHFKNQSLSYIARLTMQHTLSEVAGLGYNFGIERDVEGTTSLFYTFAPGFNIGEKWYSYAEAFGSFANGEGEHNLDGGIAFLPSANTKIDVSAGFGLGSSQLKHYIALGFSFRLPVR